jgi:hypothetical protein
MVWDCLIVGLLWLHHIQSLANVTMASGADCLLGQNHPKGVAGFKYKSCVDIL